MSGTRQKVRENPSLNQSGKAQSGSIGTKDSTYFSRTGSDYEKEGASMGTMIIMKQRNVRLRERKEEARRFLHSVERLLVPYSF